MSTTHMLWGDNGELVGECQGDCEGCGTTQQEEGTPDSLAQLDINE